MSDDFELPPIPASSKPRKAAVKAPVQEPDTPEQGEPEAQEEGPRWSTEELLQVFDNIIFSGEYSERITKGRMSVEFRTRTAEEVHSIQMAIDSADLRLIASVDSFRALKTLAHAIVSYGGKPLPTKVEEKEAFIKKMPSPLIAMLFSLLQDFDTKVASAIDEGQQNF